MDLHLRKHRHVVGCAGQRQQRGGSVFGEHHRSPGGDHAVDAHEVMKCPDRSQAGAAVLVAAVLVAAAWRRLAEADLHEEVTGQGGRTGGHQRLRAADGGRPSQRVLRALWPAPAQAAGRLVRAAAVAGLSESAGPKSGRRKITRDLTLDLATFARTGHASRTCPDAVTVSNPKGKDSRRAGFSSIWP